MRNRNNASLSTIRGTLHFTDAEMRRFISLGMERLSTLQETRGLGATEVSIKEKIEAGRRSNPGAF